MSTRWFTLPLALGIALVIAGCASDVQLGRKKDEAGQPRSWQSSARENNRDIVDDLIGTAPGVDTSESPPLFYERHYLLWRSDHRRLRTIVGRNRVGVRELLVQVTRSVGGMREVLADEGRREQLGEIQELYARIAQRSEEGVNPSSFILALDRIERQMKNEFAPGTEGLTFLPAEHFRDLEREDFEDPDEL